jgi:hypothetical protein
LSMGGAGKRFAVVLVIDRVPLGPHRWSSEP